MIRLHTYSNFAGLRIEEDKCVYRIEQIKEFEAVDKAWKEALAQILLQGSFMYLLQLLYLLRRCLLRTDGVMLVK